MDTTALRDGYRILLDAADDVAEASRGGSVKPPPPGEWDADRILAHVALVGAETLAVVARVAAGSSPTYDNRIAQDAWTIDRTIALAGGAAGLRDRIHGQGEALCALAATALSEAELDTLVPTRLLSGGQVLVDRPLPLRDLITGLAGTELPGHARQLRDLLG